MNIREALLQEHSKVQCNRIVAYIGSNRQRFDELVKLFLTDEYRVVQRAAWPLSNTTAIHPELIQKHLSKIIAHLKTPGIHNAVKRNVMRLLEKTDIPLSLQGTVMDTCFNYIADPKEAVAVKAFSLGVLGKMMNRYPEIIPELKLLIEDRLPHETAAFASRAKKLLKKMESGKIVIFAR